MSFCVLVWFEQAGFFGFYSCTEVQTCWYLWVTSGNNDKIVLLIYEFLMSHRDRARVCTNGNGVLFGVGGFWTSSGAQLVEKKNYFWNKIFETIQRSMMFYQTSFKWNFQFIIIHSKANFIQHAKSKFRSF